MRRLGDLINAVRASFPTIPPVRRGRGLKTYWTRPPFFIPSSEVLNGIPLAEFIAPQVTTKVTVLRGIFEEYVEEFLKKGSPVDEALMRRSSMSLKAKLKLNRFLADWLFPTDSLATPMHHLAVFLWYMSHAEGAYLEELSEDTILVSANGVSIGVKEHVLVSKFNNGLSVEAMDYKDALQNHHGRTRARTSFDIGLATFWYETLNISDPDLRENTQLALRILFFRFGHMGRLVDYLYKGFTSKPINRHGHRNACVELVDKLTTVPNPMPMIFRVLIDGRFMKKDEICADFGADAAEWAAKPEDAPVSLDRILHWNNTLLKLANKKPIEIKEGDEDEDE